MSSPTLGFEIDVFLSPMWYSLESADADVDVDFSLSNFPDAPSSSLSVDLFGSNLSKQTKVEFLTKPYPVEYLGAGFLDFPSEPPKVVPNKLRRSAGFVLSMLLLALLWLLDGGIDSSMEERFVEVKEMGVETVSLAPSPLS